MHTQFPQMDILSLVAARMGIAPQFILPILIFITFYTLVLKGFALWYAARNRQKIWFIVMLTANGLGIPELIYLTWFRRDTRQSVTPSLFDSANDGTVAESPAESS